MPCRVFTAVVLRADVAFFFTTVVFLAGAVFFVFLADAVFFFIAVAFLAGAVFFFSTLRFFPR